MSRKRCQRRRITSLPPPGLRRMLDAGQRIELGLVHWQNLDAIATGQANVQTLAHWVEGVHTWSRVADLLANRNPDHAPAVSEMRAQLELATRLVERYGASGRIGLTGPQYQLAKRGAAVMDALAHTVDQPTASAAADWSEQQMARLAIGAERNAR